MKKIYPLIGLAVVIVVVFSGLFVTRNIGKSDRTVSMESADRTLDKMLGKIDINKATPVKSAIDFTVTENDGSELPDVDDSSITVRANTSLWGEIISSPEKAGSGTDGWLVEMAEKFNRSGATVNGEPVSIQIRNITSGLAMDYIRTGKYVAEGFSPSNSMWIKMLESYGVGTTVIDESMVGNTAVIVLENRKYKEFIEKYGAVDLKSVVDAVESGEFVIGYTNPFTSSTGLNFLVSTLQRYDRNNPLSPEAADGFSRFQNNIPLVAYNTMQMREAASRGTLDGFVLEMQSYKNDSGFSKNYTATPFGYRHDNPLALIDECDEDRKEVVRLFSEFCESSEAHSLATKYGFNDMNDYNSEEPELDGDTIRRAQKYYKESKDAGKEVIGVFVADVSGSMDGAPLHSLKESLINSIQYISPNNYIGLVSYSDEVTIEVPIGKFSLEQQAYFKGGVENLYANGGTATYDAVCVAMSMIREELPNHENAKPIIFVLSDGETNSGYSLKDISDVVSSLHIPVYTINYNYGGSEALKNLSNINEAASINADSDDVVYQLKNLLNASM